MLELIFGLLCVGLTIVVVVVFFAINLYENHKANIRDSQFQAVRWKPVVPQTIDKNKEKENKEEKEEKIPQNKETMLLS